MIVVTGPGRSGTSVIAALYREVGLDPGGTWFPSVSAGLEDPEIVRANQLLMRELGIRGPQRAIPARALRAAHAVVPRELGRRVLRTIMGTRGVGRRRIRLPSWDRLASTVERHGPMLRTLAGSRSVAKDPRFVWTLPAWLAAEAPIEHVVLCVRSLEAMVRSRVEAGMVAPESADHTRNLYAFGIGLALTTIHDHRVSHSILRFPDFLERPDEVREAMRLPRASTAAAFGSAFSAVVDPSMVRHGD